MAMSVILSCMPDFQVNRFASLPDSLSLISYEPAHPAFTLCAGAVLVVYSRAGGVGRPPLNI